MQVNEPLKPANVYPLPQYPEPKVIMNTITISGRELQGEWSCSMADLKPLHGGGITRFYLLTPKRQRREQRQNKKKGSKMHRIENRKLVAKIVDMMTYTADQQRAILRMYGIKGGVNPILYTTESGIEQQLDKFEPGEIGELKVLTFVGGHPKMRKFTFRMKKKQD